MKRFVTVIVVLLIIAHSMEAHAKTDVVRFPNGDRLTGEIKTLERGRLRFKTAATDTIAIEWDDVASLTSKQNIQVETQDGTRYLGTLETTPASGHIVVEFDGKRVELDTNEVVHLTPIEATRIERLDGDITAGYNFAKASEVQQFVLGLDADYRTETRIFALSADSTISDSEDSETSRRGTIALQYKRLWPNRWLTGVMLSLDRNDELGLDLRTSLGVGGGRILRQTNNTNLELTGGIQVSREDLDGPAETEQTIEAVGSLGWDWFRYDTPELDLSTRLDVIPNLTEPGRVRAELDVNLKWEIVEDLFWQLNFYNSYDSEPPVVDAEKTDYGVNTSLGWEF